MCGQPFLFDDVFKSGDRTSTGFRFHQMGDGAIESFSRLHAQTFGQITAQGVSDLLTAGMSARQGADARIENEIAVPFDASQRTFVNSRVDFMQIDVHGEGLCRLPHGLNGDDSDARAEPCGLQREHADVGAGVDDRRMIGQ